MKAAAGGGGKGMRIVRNKEKLEKKLSQAQLTEIAQSKAADMNTEDVEAIKKMVAGTARSMGVEVED